MAAAAQTRLLMSLPCAHLETPSPASSSSYIPPAFTDTARVGFQRRNSGFKIEINRRVYESKRCSLSGKLLWHNSEMNKQRTQRLSAFVVARLFGPATFEASKLKVLFLEVDEEKHPGYIPRTYTLTHSDITAKLTLAISQTINRSQLQGWYNRLQRDEVVAEWMKAQGKMSLHVHCHISGGHWLLELIAKLRFYIFHKEMPMVLEAFRHGDGTLFSKHPELEQALVWVHFHSNLKEYNRVECWGPLKDATKGASMLVKQSTCNEFEENGQEWPKDKVHRPCQNPCNCCFSPFNLDLWPADLDNKNEQDSQ